MHKLHNLKGNVWIDVFPLCSCPHSVLFSPCGRAIWTVMEKLVINSPYICLSQWLVLWQVLSTHPLCSLSNFKASCCSGSCSACRRFCNWSLILAFTSDKLVKKKLNFQFVLDFTGLGVTSRIRSELVSLKPHIPSFNYIGDLQILPILSVLAIWTPFYLWKLGLCVWHVTGTPKWETDLCRVVRAECEHRREACPSADCGVPLIYPPVIPLYSFRTSSQLTFRPSLLPAGSWSEIFITAFISSGTVRRESLPEPSTTPPTSSYLGRSSGRLGGTGFADFCCWFGSQNSCKVYLQMVW